MEKNFLIQRYFQRADQLTVTHSSYRKNISKLFSWLLESDRAKNDITTSGLGFKLKTSARVVNLEPIVIAGLEEIDFFVSSFSSLSFSSNYKDGDIIKNGKTLATLHGDISEILAFERTILNILQRLSGIATATNNIVRRVRNQSANVDPWACLNPRAGRPSLSRRRVRRRLQIPVK